MLALDTCSHANTAAKGPAKGPMTPRIATCEPRARATIVGAYSQAYQWAVAARDWLAALARGGSVRSKWNASHAARLFGPFRPIRAKRVIRVFEGVVARFQRGYESGGRHVAPTVQCFPASYSRCRTGLLGNASVFGTIRLCPQLLRRPIVDVAAIVLHEVMHQALGVGDRRHESCEGSRHRCYRGGADDLVAAGRHDLAVRNIDNYVAFARRVAGTR